MDLTHIKDEWKNQMNADSAASICAWDSVAGNYVYDGSLNFENNSFLKFMQSKIKLSSEMTVLDVGCGAGAYSLALSSKVKKVVGVDFSPKMIEAAKCSAAKEGIENAEFFERDWHNCDGSEFSGQFDLVFARTTPAIADYESFVKMMKASRKYCFFCKPARRTDKVFDQLRALLGMENTAHDDSVAYAFDTVWMSGFNPEVSYEETVWKSRKTIEDAKIWYLGRLQGSSKLTNVQKDAVCQYLAQISKEGMVEEETRTTLVNMFWEIK